MRGLKSEDTVLELKQWVKDFQTLPGGPLQMLPNASRKSKNLLLTVQGMISHVLILNVREEAILEVDCRIKLFLSYFHSFDQEIIGNANDDTPVPANNEMVPANDEIKRTPDGNCEFENNVSIDMDDSSSNSDIHPDINLSDVGVVGFNPETEFTSRDVNFSAVGQEIITHKKKTMKKRKPSWTLAPNFVSLLNIPNAMRRFGPLQHLWEDR